MKRKELTENVAWVGSTDWQRRLFDSMLPIPDGTTYTVI